MFACPNCGGRFFKTLELRFQVTRKEISAILYKKRCKRCKQNCFTSLCAENGKACFGFVTVLEWQQAKRIDRYTPLYTSTVYQPLVGQYTALISRDTAKSYNTVLRKQ